MKIETITEEHGEYLVFGIHWVWWIMGLTILLPLTLLIPFAVAQALLGASIIGIGTGVFYRAFKFRHWRKT